MGSLLILKWLATLIAKSCAKKEIYEAKALSGKIE